VWRSTSDKYVATSCSTGCLCCCAPACGSGAGGVSVPHLCHSATPGHVCHVHHHPGVGCLMLSLASTCQGGAASAAHATGCWLVLSSASSSVARLAASSAYSLPSTPVCALTLYILIVWPLLCTFCRMDKSICLFFVVAHKSAAAATA
jgi:hypothetical protein